MIKNVKIDGSKLNTPERRLKAILIGEEMKTILQSNYFRGQILYMDREYWLVGESDDSAFKNLTNAQIYDKIVKAQEEWNTEEDYEVDILVDDYYARFSSVIAFMNPGKPTIYVNTKFFDYVSRKEAGSNFAHEWVHTLGSRHSGKYLTQSLPYFINLAYERAYERFFVNNLQDVDLDNLPPVEIPTVPTPAPNEYKVVCKWFGWRMFIGRKTCYRVYDV